ncbi:bifunctional 2-C-methyl-D-erythritol 4-phosphate cytidylyltransferase/2-C-methyl-D-erythritol 2,4-cyclodiphosphate synthase [Parvularcula marina]|uniref:Bifunctional enzyme IspD/IspF n=1 Tax=Parvularcula marina TaxID=2292771 RepID=A0A371R7Z4_9PROT|nr:bifunctional 2-C-methyl-D-erythritol 4-phosphate cytidylyltransferase/2-C-methyl-D-erythritol 2,4-cyclodiphosphate synthase [Parvularcula marina]RFB01548.1 bifunctional 2-C-methyl-D-erythritol 4-phosphate cytidylyltransferase/2-C-methyl-D-erythritol 2,4-cyclodiphosphate synthase [Parvularcula marina]
MSNPEIIAVIVAGGKGSRARTGLPKQYMPLGDAPVLRRTATAFSTHPRIDAVLCVIGDEDGELYENSVRGLSKMLDPAIGGENRQASVRNGLRALTGHSPQMVLIHDGARPFISHETITGVIEALHQADGAIAALPVSDTLKRANRAMGIEETVPREGLWRAQTPQGFRYEVIHNLHEDAEPGTATDDAALLEARGIHVAIVPDLPTNIKLTYKEDFDVAEKLIAGTRRTHIGQGFDVHAFEDGDAVTLGGVEIPHTQKLKGHSDADVALHALTDALLGAIGEGDIGTHFPPSDEKWRGAASHLFVEHAAKLISDRGGEIGNIDLTLIAEAPKVGPHRAAMREKIAGMLGLDEARISIKATTTEGLGFTGRKEGIACQAAVTVIL